MVNFVHAVPGSQYMLEISRGVVHERISLIRLQPKPSIFYLYCRVYVANEANEGVTSFDLFLF